MMNKPTYLTKEGEIKLRKELEELEGPKRQELARRLRIAIQQGDLSENADYIATKEEQGFLEGRIQDIEAMLRNVVIIEEGGERDTVDIGAHVTIQEGDYPPETYYLVGSNEANPREGRISQESPIGKALMGKKVGDTAEAEAPGGMIRLKILKIE
jgi:transcription elongation factor GreA